jgi:SAM-dependent methyltransferase
MRELGGDVSLVDYSAESLRLIRELAKRDEVMLVMGDARGCPFDDETFDIVFHQGLLEHFSSPFPLLLENRRILKKGGFLVIDVPQTFHVYTLMKHALMVLGMWFGGWERQFTIASLTKLVRALGFEPVHVYGDWSRPGILYKIVRQISMKFGVRLPMYPKYLGRMTADYYKLQDRLREKKLFLYTVLSIGVVARKK